MRRLRDLCDRHGILVVLDEIQTGCGRTGPFFAFERSGIVPDLVTMSKSIGGYGLPMSILLLRRAHDVWKSGEHVIDAEILKEGSKILVRASSA